MFILFTKCSSGRGNYTLLLLNSAHFLSLRLSGDVQDFKSSFKMVVSQGLRSSAQVVGCVASLYLISPQMTAMAAVGLPTMIAVGSLFGAVLRR